MTFLRYGQSPFKAEFVGKLLLMFKIPFGLMQLHTVNVRNTVGDDMAVQVIFILMHTNQILMTGEKLFSKFFSDFKHLLWCDLFIFMEADDVVGIHSSGVFIPESLFSKPRLIDFIIVDGLP